MNFLKKIFRSQRKAHPPEILLGRYTDVFKTSAQRAHWERALREYREGRMVEAYQSLLLFLSDEDGQNVQWRAQEGGISFTLQQGSQRIVGSVSAERVRAESALARAETLSVGFMRRLMEHNAALRFCRFALSPDNIIALCFDTPTTDASPQHLLRALRELAYWADKHDDLLLDEFGALQPAAPTGEPLPEAEKEAKYAFLCEQIRAALDLMAKSHPRVDQHPGAYAYLLLATLYRLDYLVRPEGFVMDVIERASQNYSASDGQNIHAKIEALQHALKKILSRSREQVMAEMYRTRATFSVVQPIPFDHVTQIISRELPNMEWPLENRFDALAMAVPQYIVGFILFHYAPPKPIYELFRLFMHATEPHFFQTLGLPTLLQKDGRIDRRAVLSAMQEIVRKNQEQYPRLRLPGQALNFSSLLLFGKSFLEMILRLDLSQR